MKFIAFNWRDYITTCFNLQEYIRPISRSHTSRKLNINKIEEECHVIRQSTSLLNPSQRNNKNERKENLTILGRNPGETASKCPLPNRDLYFFRRQLRRGMSEYRISLQINHFFLSNCQKIVFMSGFIFPRSQILYQSNEILVSSEVWRERERKKKPRNFSKIWHTVISSSNAWLFRWKWNYCIMFETSVCVWGKKIRGLYSWKTIHFKLRKVRMKWN